MNELTPMRRLWSVTTLIKAALGISEGIARWQVSQAAAKAYDGYKTLATFVERGDRDDAVKWIAARDFRARVRGTEIHAITEKIALGQEPEYDPAHEPYVRQYRAWLAAFEPTFVMAEAPVYNLDYGYAGTLDGILELGGRRFLFDYKTTEHPPDGEKARPPFPEVALQLAAYAHATEVGVLSEQRYDSGKRYYVYDPTTKHEPMPPVDGALCIVVSPHDCVAVPVRIDEDVWATFTRVRYVAQFVLESKEMALFGPPLPAPTRQEAPA